ncbi:MAG: hypothetical protein U0R71_03465 [Solirubrobacterales bacterium]
MKLNKLVDKAKKTIDQRGGMDALKADAEELKSIAKGKGSITEKAKAAGAAIKEPGAPKADADAPAEPAAKSDPPSPPPASE